MSAKNVLIISSQSSLSTSETTSSSQSKSASIFSSSSTRDKRAIKDNLSLSNDLSEIDRTSLDIAELLSKNIEEKRVRKSKKIANLAVVSSLDIYSSLDISLIDIVASKNTNSNEMKNIYSTFAVITKSTRLHRDNLFSSLKL
jgi:hypothetical protein